MQALLKHCAAAAAGAAAAGAPQANSVLAACSQRLCNVGTPELLPTTVPAAPL
jgi:hypothetical protein